MKPCILVVDDEPNIADNLRITLIVACTGAVSDVEPLSVPHGVRVAPKASDLRDLRAALREVAPQASEMGGAGHVAELEEDTDWRD